MDTLLQLIGLGWACVGGVNLYRSGCWTEGDEIRIALIVSLNLLIFILPGLALRNVGKALEGLKPRPRYQNR